MRLALPGGPASVAAEPGRKLSHAVWLSGLVPPLPLCDGQGLCGRCRARFTGEAPQPSAVEQEFFSGAELAAGWRLLCRHAAREGGPEIELELPDADLAAPRASRAARGKPGDDAGGRKCGALGFDLGTTSMEWRLLDISGEELAAGSCLNPQAGAGADVVSRLAMAREAAGRERLSRLARESFSGVLASLRSDGLTASRACLAANPAMTGIFLNMDISGLCAAPYAGADFGARQETFYDGAERLPLLLPPQPGPFVGGDTSCGLLALMEAGTPRPFVLADLGTNGELALLDAAGRLYLTSVPLGPALEGIGPACGQMAAPGVFTSFSIGPEGLVGHAGLGPGAVRGISATGYLSLLARLLALGLMDSAGHFRPEQNMPLARIVAGRLGAGRLELGRGLYLAARDVELLLHVKAAFAVALRRLLRAASLDPAGLRSVCVAGALGRHASPEDLEALGFLPPGLAVKTRATGNSALDGACILARYPEKLAPLAALCKKARILNLGGDPSFQEEYLAAMNFSA